MVIVLVHILDVARSNRCVALSVLVGPAVNFFLTLEESAGFIHRPHHAGHTLTAQVGILCTLVTEVQILVVGLRQYHADIILELADRVAVVDAEIPSPCLQLREVQIGHVTADTD